MKALRLTGVEKRLCAAAARGEAASFVAGERIGAELLQRLLASLPLGKGGVCALTPKGLHVVGATIGGRLDLDNVTMVGGAPVAALVFERCRLEGGFSGAHGHFSRLCFTDCSFGDSPMDEEGRPLPSLELSGSAVDTDLCLRGLHPADPRQGRLWIRAIGARIDGRIDLSRSRLRGPRQEARQLTSGVSFDALDLSLAEVKGDFLFVNGCRCRGRMNFRNAVIEGDVWMSGADLKTDRPESLFFQRARIGGVLMLDGRHDRADRKGRFRRFRSQGEIDLHDLRLGGSLVLQDVELAPSTGQRCLYLGGARVGGSVVIGAVQEKKSRLEGKIFLAAMEVTQELVISNACLGVEVEEADWGETVSAESITAKRVVVSGVEPFPLEGQGDWEFEPRMKSLSINLENSKIESLVIVDSRLSGSLNARSLKCSGDAVFDARIGVRVDLEAADIGGSLDISELRMDRTAAGLRLKDANIGRALRLKRPSEGGEARRSTLLGARRTALRCLPGVRLVETLWRYEREPGKPAVSQVAFLEKRGLIHLLDRRPETLDRFVRRYGHAVDDRRNAAEYLRLFCAYGQDEQSPLLVITGKTGLPPFLTVHSDEPSRDADWRDGLGPRDFGMRRKKVDEHFEVRACLLRGDHLYNGSFTVTASDQSVCVAKANASDQDESAPADTPVSPRLDNAPRFSGQFTYHPDSHRNGDAWVTEPILEGWVPEPDASLPALEARLLPYLQSRFSMHGEVDLRDLCCDTLDDEGGRFWGQQLQIKMDHFVYRQTNWEPDLSDRRRTLRGRWADWKARFAAEWLWYWCIKRLGLVETLRQSADFWEPWQTRRNWIYQQFESKDELCPSRHKIEQAEYRPQPFEQAIRVARAEGRDDFAIHFEILKRKVEWRLFTRRSAQPLLLLAYVAATVWLLATGGWHFLTSVALLGLVAAIVVCILPKQKFLGGFDFWLRAAALIAIVGGTTWFLGMYEWDRPRNFLIAVFVLIVIRFISAISDWIMHWMFGYLRRPVRAIATLIGAFLIGWAGVHFAIKQNMLVVDVEPVASMVGRDMENRRILLGIASAQDQSSLVRNVSCAGTVSEALYALDVLIPLIDLRAESRCEVGRATPFDVAETAGSARALRNWVRAIQEWTVESEGFWSVLKALYAIAGWFIVSLSILTFAHINQARSDPA